MLSGCSFEALPGTETAYPLYIPDCRYRVPSPKPLKSKPTTVTLKDCHPRMPDVLSSRKNKWRNGECERERERKKNEREREKNGEREREGERADNTLPTKNTNHKN